MGDIEKVKKANESNKVVESTAEFVNVCYSSMTYNL